MIVKFFQLAYQGKRNRVTYVLFRDGESHSSVNSDFVVIEADSLSVSVLCSNRVHRGHQ